MTSQHISATRLGSSDKGVTLTCLADLSRALDSTFSDWLDGVGDPNAQVVSMMVVIRSARLILQTLIIADDATARLEAGGG